MVQGFFLKPRSIKTQDHSSTGPTKLASVIISKYIKKKKTRPEVYSSDLRLSVRVLESL